MKPSYRGKHEPYVLKWATSTAKLPNYVNKSKNESPEIQADLLNARRLSSQCVSLARLSSASLIASASSLARLGSARV